jgi:Tfp pilus assembly protein PilZ
MEPVGRRRAEAREHPRFVMDAAVEIATADGEAMFGRTRNLSRGGLCVEIDSPLRVGSSVEVRIALVFQDEQRSEPLPLPSRIVWCTPLGAAHQIGVQFLRLSFYQAANLDLFLSYIDASPSPDAGD